MSEIQSPEPTSSWRGWLITGGVVALPLGFGILATQNQAAEWLLSRFSDLFDILTIVGGVISFGFWLCDRGRSENR